MFEVFDHTADIGLRIRAATLEELFCEAAAGLFALIVSNSEKVESRVSVEFSIAMREGEFDFLLFDWLNELLFTFDGQRLVLSKFEVRLTPGGIQATVWGEPLDPSRHHLEHEVKAITYHGLTVTQEADGWLAEVILDI